MLMASRPDRLGTQRAFVVRRGAAHHADAARLRIAVWFGSRSHFGRSQPREAPRYTRFAHPDIELCYAAEALTTLTEWVVV